MAPNHATRLARGALLTFAAGALALTGAGCSLLGDEGAVAGPTAAAPTGAGGVGSAPADGPDSGSGTEADAGGGSSNGGNDDTGDNTKTGTKTGTGTGTGTDTGSTTDAGTGPKIVYFRVKQKPRCPQGTNVHPIEGSPLVVEWKVTGAHQAELAVDGPGVYNSYGLEGSETFTFSCGGAPGTVEQHTYRLTTVGGGSPRTKTISASATTYEIAVVD
jgi:hypothetical protein